MCEPIELRRAQRVIERTADRPAAFLSREVSDAGDPTWDHAALELDFEQPAQREGTGVQQADAVRRDVLHLGRSGFGFGNGERPNPPAVAEMPQNSECGWMPGRRPRPCYFRI